MTAAPTDDIRGTSWPLARRLWREHILPYRKLILLNFVLIAGVAVTTACYPLLIRWALDRYQAGDLAPLAYAPWLIILVTAAKGATLYGHMALTNLIASSVTRDLQSAMFARLVGADLLQLDREAPAAAAQRFATDLVFVQDAVSRAITSLVRDVLMIVALVIAMLWIDWQLSLAGLIVLPIAAWPVAEVGRRLRQTARRTAERTGDMSSIVTETLSGARMVKTYRLEGYVAAKAREVFDTLHGLRVRAANQYARVEPILEALGGLAVAGVLVLIGWRIASGASSLGDFVGFVSALLIAAQPMRSLGNVNGILQQGLAAAERIFSIIDREAAIRDKANAAPLAVTTGEVHLDDVSFRFPDGTLALDGVSLTVPGGKRVALVGRSGSGKSTVFNLVPRLYEASAGRVVIDGQDVKDVTLASLRGAIGLVSQDVIVFDDTVAANIAFGRPEASAAEIEAAARAAAAHDFISRMPLGYQTRLGAAGTRLSGGERQRLALARAILKNAPILLLDEATSALDAESEHLVETALERLEAGRTTLVIAHRLSTVRGADSIVVLDKGRIVEQGPHDELIARDGAYAALYRLQFRDG
jgi:subfamily B ATP-binding cassette protein MsbA